MHKTIKKNKYKMLAILLAVFGILLTSVGITYSLFSYNGVGSKVSSITSEGINFNYKEGNKKIELTDSPWMSDELGKVQNEYFEFEISGKSINNIAIPYFITIKKTAESSNIDDVIKLYLTTVDKDGNESEIAFSTVDKLSNYKNDTIGINNSNEKVLYQSMIEENASINQKYRLRMWIDEDIDLSSEKYNDALFELTVNVYTNGEVDDSKKFVIADNATNLVTQMKAGYNLGNSLDAHKKDIGFRYNTETLWDNPVTTQETVDMIKNMGFTTLRIPVTYYNHMDENGIIDPNWLNRVEEVVNYALNDDMFVIINIHHDVGTWIYADVKTYDTDLANIKGLWTQIADHFKDYDNRLLFELQNEIINTDNNWDWGTEWDDFRKVHDMDQELITLVRQSGGNNGSRFILVSPFGASTDSCEIEQLMYKSFDDTIPDHLLMSLHTYTNNTDSITNLFTRLNGYVTKYNIPIVLTETGTMNTVAEATRLAAAEKFAELAVQYNIGLFWWDDGAKLALFNRNTNTYTYKGIADVIVSKYNQE